MVNEVEGKIKYSFKNKDLLEQAFVHSSYANEFNLKSNERLEFLGDSVLGLIITEYLFKIYSENEGVMSKIKAQIVSATTLSNLIDKLNLKDYIKLGKSLKGNKNIANIKADLFESLLGAIYLDGGFANAKNFVFRCINVQQFIKTLPVDYKTELQEYTQSKSNSNLSYNSTKNQDGEFTSSVVINSKAISSSTAHNKKLAEAQAAKIALDILKKQEGLDEF